MSIPTLKVRLREVATNATQKRFSAWQGATGAGTAEIHSDEILRLLDSHDALEKELETLRSQKETLL